jgi:hypothetical protein
MEVQGQVKHTRGKGRPNGEVPFAWSLSHFLGTKIERRTKGETKPKLYTREKINSTKTRPHTHIPYLVYTSFPPPPPSPLPTPLLFLSNGCMREGGAVLLPFRPVRGVSLCRSRYFLYLCLYFVFLKEKKKEKKNPHIYVLFWHKK